MNDINKEKAQRLSSTFVQVFGNPFSIDFNIDKFILKSKEQIAHNIYLYNRFFGTGGINALARVIIIETLNTECVYYNDEINRIDGEKWKVDRDVILSWYVIEPEIKNILESIENIISRFIRDKREQYKLETHDFLSKKQKEILSLT
ncbi:hypothetical protein EIM44_09760 [Bibersteinia trehalosi]|uniref:Uncharacterized protein n=1 Tax=Bibersteinia trehalosi TaxID=47735 RepID=A0A3R8NG41_BIBTR|nr:hypothetical protein [Bibersteinia trehalosi]RRN01792.1 hypothetical protein EIM44_09760 [Bibersteinia trehalosi]